MVQFKHIISTVDSHTAGEPTRLVVSGLPSLPGATMAEKMTYARNKLDDLRRLLLLEPRGRQDMYGAVLTTPTDPQADFGLIFMNTQQYTTMCGHAVIGAATTLVEIGMVEAVEPETTVTFDTPVGLVRTRIQIEAGRVREVSFDNTPVFAYQLDARLSVPDLGDVLADIVYSGGFFALVKAQRTGLELVPANVEALLDMGIRIRDAAQSQLSVRHPELPFTNLIDTVEFCGPAERQADGALHVRNTVILGNRTVDRSPCGTGTCARMAVLRARGELKLGEEFVSESIIGTRFTGRIVGETHVGEFKAILPRVAGRAHLTGMHQFVLDPDDPFPHGFFLTDSETKE
ncbi:MAG TPA: proline racemase family protein [Anaerolineales bacterium]